MGEIWSKKWEGRRDRRDHLGDAEHVGSVELGAAAQGEGPGVDAQEVVAAAARGAGCPVDHVDVHAGAAAAHAKLVGVGQVGEHPFEVDGAEDRIVVPRLVPARVPGATAAAKQRRVLVGALVVAVEVGRHAAEVERVGLRP